jgi:serine/threonine-protein phosphatase 2A regulatory subunit B''
VTNNLNQIDYESFKQVALKLDPEHAAEYCNPGLFLKFYKDDHGRISIPNYFNYVLRKVSLIQNRITLCKYDEDADNYMSEKVCVFHSSSEH